MVKKAAFGTKRVAGPSGVDANTWQKLFAARKNALLTTDFFLEKQ